MDKVVHVPVPYPDFLKDIGSILEAKLESRRQKDLDERLLNSAEVMALLNISRGTLSTWVYEKKIPVFRAIKGKNFFKYADIICSLKQRSERAKKKLQSTKKEVKSGT